MDGQADPNYDVNDLLGGGQCDDAIRTLYHFLDGELTPERRRAIQRHLDECAPCLKAFDFEAELKILVARCCRDQVPEHLRIRVAEVLAKASEHEQGPYR
jgi:mycothiol system anti-sigma-R factor